ncbi:MAG: hypothetical protein ACPKQO_11440 [Nitrososphaeraceae archaeon]
MKKPYILLSFSLILTIFISAQPAHGGKLEAFIGPGEFATAMCGTDKVKGDLLNFELDVEEWIQINCGPEQEAGTNVDVNITINEGESLKIVCVPPITAGEVVAPMTLNSTQKVFCTTTGTAD